MNDPVKYLKLVNEKYLGVPSGEIKYNEKVVLDFIKDEYDYYIDNNDTGSRGFHLVSSEFGTAATKSEIIISLNHGLPFL